MTVHIQFGKIQPAQSLDEFLVNEALPGLNITRDKVYAGLEGLIRDFGQRGEALLTRRDTLQMQIDDWHKARKGQPHDQDAYIAELKRIGYLENEVADFKIGTQNVDQELKTAGPQLVAPLSNPRFATNAANARYGSLYGALYESNIVPETGNLARGKGYNVARGAEVIKRTEQLLDEAFELKDAQGNKVSHAEVTAYAIVKGTRNKLVATLKSGGTAELKDPAQFAGHNGTDGAPSAVLLQNNGMHLEITIDRSAERGKLHPAGVQDIVTEAALTTIFDLEDSVAVVKARDMVEGYRNWLALQKGTLTASFLETRDEVTKVKTRGLAMAHRQYMGADNQTLLLNNRVLNLIRNPGIYMPPNDTVKTQAGNCVQEFLVSTLMTTLIAMHGLKGDPETRNSRMGSIYQVLPKGHGPAEIAYACEVFDRVEDILGLQRNTLKIGIMDEERRTSLNLKNTVFAAKDRVFFINTGFLDRTGDEYHTSMQAGRMEIKSRMKAATWFEPYELNNSKIGLMLGFPDQAQIGKGMWAEPENMLGLLNTKMQHLLMGGTTAWCPSPKGAIVHATHYLSKDVKGEVHPQLLADFAAKPADYFRNKIGTIPFSTGGLTDEQRLTNLDNNMQAILGYAARWIKFGIGCSSVPNMMNVALMEDCATMRIAVQDISNALLHGEISQAEIDASMKRLATKVDQQNQASGDLYIKDNYRPMTVNYNTDNTILAANELIATGEYARNGYVQPTLYKFRKQEIDQFGEKANPPWRQTGAELQALADRMNAAAQQHARP